jgi:glycosyltransferase involved in cell wall biosynthesis
MRIALVSQTYPPMVSGLSMAVCQLAEGLAERGHQVLVLAASERGESHTDDTPNLHLTRLRSFPTPLRVGQRWCWWPRRVLMRHLRAFRPELVHLHDPTLGALQVPGPVHQLGLPLVITVHALPINVVHIVQAPRRLQRWIESTLWHVAARRLTRFDAVVAPSEYAAASYARHAGGHPIAISNGVDLLRFHPGSGSSQERESLAGRFGLDPGRPILLHVGRLDREKDVDLVIRAAARTMGQADAQLLVIGDGNDRRRLMSLVRELGIEDRSCLPGYLGREDLPPAYCLATVFAISSRIEAEGIVVLEAAASGLPVVAVRATSMPELVERSGCGYLVEPGDVEGMADRLVGLLHDPAQRERLSLAALAMARQHSYEITLDRHEALYRRLIGDALPSNYVSSWISPQTFNPPTVSTMDGIST